jgi:hypothetical protein
MLYATFFGTQNLGRWIFSVMRVEGTVLMESIEKRTRKDKMETRTLGKIRKHEHHKEEPVIFRKDVR